MIDSHCHVLPGMDDGPETWDEALDICRTAAADGVKSIVATPHFNPGIYDWTWGEVLEAAAMLETAVEKEGLDLRILPGAELSVFPELPSFVEKGGSLTINGGIYLLIEFLPHLVPAKWDVFLLSFLDMGFIPIIAHPERNHWLMNHPESLFPLVRRGVMLQLTAASITGGLGMRAQDSSVYLLRHNLAHVIASDAHSPDLRPAVLSGAVSIASHLVGAERATAMVTSVPEAIISGMRIPAPEPPTFATPAEGLTRKWFQRIFY